MDDTAAPLYFSVRAAEALRIQGCIEAKKRGAAGAGLGIAHNMRVIPLFPLFLLLGGDAGRRGGVGVGCGLTTGGRVAPWARR